MIASKSLLFAARLAARLSVGALALVIASPAFAADAGPENAPAKSTKGPTTKGPKGKKLADAPDDAVQTADTPAGAPPANRTAMADLKKSNDALDKLLKKQRPDWSPETEAQKADVRKIVGAFLDYQELAHRSLAKHWDTLTPKQRAEFVATLRELVERSYLKQMRGDPNYTMSYEHEERNGNEATVDATLHTTSRNKKVNITLEYKLLWKGRWLVYDVITDDQSMLENYRAEFNKIIAKESFDALLKKMRKKVDEGDDKDD